MKVRHTVRQISEKDIWAFRADADEDFCYRRNHLYSVSSLTDASGIVVERYTYDGYGKMYVRDASGALKSSQVPVQGYGFTGRRYDGESGLWYFRARYFDDQLGRFVNRDPAGYVNGMSLYRGWFVPNYNDMLGLPIIIEPANSDGDYDREGRRDLSGILRTLCPDVGIDSNGNVFYVNDLTDKECECLADGFSEVPDVESNSFAEILVCISARHELCCCILELVESGNTF